MCGIPHHAAEAYDRQAAQARAKVAIATNSKKPARQTGQTRVTQILSPGTHFDAHLLQAERNIFWRRFASDGKFGLALLDLTTATSR